MKIPQGVVDRRGSMSFNILVKRGQNLDILVENQGRVNYGSQINQNKKVYATKKPTLNIYCKFLFLNKHIKFMEWF